MSVTQHWGMFCLFLTSLHVSIAALNASSAFNLASSVALAALFPALLVAAPKADFAVELA